MIEGYSKPPTAMRFQKGRSGNPNGRPRNRHKTVPYDSVLGQMVTVREDGRERRVTAVETFLLQLTQKGLAGDSAAARDLPNAIENARSERGDDGLHIDAIILSAVGFGADAILELLGLAKMKYPADKKRVRRELNPWIVEAALERLGKRRLAVQEQQEVWAATRTPGKVSWPEWWEVNGECLLRPHCRHPDRSQSFLIPATRPGPRCGHARSQSAIGTVRTETVS